MADVEVRDLAHLDSEGLGGMPPVEASESRFKPNKLEVAGIVLLVIGTVALLRGMGILKKEKKKPGEDESIR